MGERATKAPLGVTRAQPGIRSALPRLHLHVCARRYSKKYRFICLTIAQLFFFPLLYFFFWSLPDVNIGDVENGDRVNFSLIF